jgi:hypothetical protein
MTHNGLRNGRDKASSVGMSATPEHLSRRPQFYDATQVHDRHAIAEMVDDAQIMADEYQRETELSPKIRQEVQDLGAY